MNDSPEEAEALAQKFHEAYERLAPLYNYKTRKASAVPWADVPEDNKRLMIAVCQEILRVEIDPAEPTPLYDSLMEQMSGAPVTFPLEEVAKEEGVDLEELATPDEEIQAISPTPPEPISYINWHREQTRPLPPGRTR